jgi:hypothetical protein
MALSQELYGRCHQTLLKCSEFDSHGALQAIFVTEELVMYRDSLPTSSSKSELISKVIDYLLPKRLSDGRPVFAIFLNALQLRYHSGDELHDELTELYSDAEQSLNRVEFTNIPFVVVAMTQDEAAELMTENVFDDPMVAPIERTRFRVFKEALQEHDVADLLLCYGKQREAWKPHILWQHTIQEIILEIIDLINQQRAEILNSSMLFPEFFSSNFFAKDESTRLETWDQLERQGCVIIVDPVSVFHPVLRRFLLKSEMGSNDRTAILGFSPVDANTIPVNQLLEEEIGSQMQRAFARFSKHLDRLCEFGVGDLRTLQRWLFAILPETATIVQNQRPNPSNRQKLRRKMGEPRGKKGLIFGQRGGR